MATAARCDFPRRREAHAPANQPLPAPGMAQTVAPRSHAGRPALPEWIWPQLTQLVKETPEGDQWLHEIKYDGFRIHARLDHGEVRLLTRNGLDWTHKYPQTAAAVALLDARLSRRRIVRRAPRRHHLVQHYPVGLRRRQRRRPCVLPVRSSLSRRRGSQRTAADRAQRAARRFGGACKLRAAVQHHQTGLGLAFYEKACALAVEGIVSKRADAAYMPGNRGLWLKVKRLNREEFVVVGWSDPEGSRPFIGSLLLGYYDPDGRLIFAGWVGSGLREQGQREMKELSEITSTWATRSEAVPDLLEQYGCSPIRFSGHDDALYERANALRPPPGRSGT